MLSNHSVLTNTAIFLKTSSLPVSQRPVFQATVTMNRPRGVLEMGDFITSPTACFTLDEGDAFSLALLLYRITSHVMICCSQFLPNFNKPSIPYASDFRSYSFLVFKAQIFFLQVD